MAKRFIDPDRRKQDMRGMDIKHRLANYWLWENCDAAGVWRMDAELFRFELGFKLDVEGFLKASPWVRKLSNGSLFITDYIEVNYGELKPGCNPHKPVLRSLEANGIDLNETLQEGLNNPSTRVVDEDEEEDNSGKKERASAKEPKVIQLPFTSEAFALAWAGFETMRVKKRKPMTERARAMILADCLKFGEAQAIQALNTSERNGWTDIYPPKTEASGSHASTLKTADPNKRITAQWE